MAAPTSTEPARRADMPAILGHGGPPPWLRRLGRITLSGVAIGALVYLFVPIFVVIAYSFDKPLGKYNFVWHQFLLDAWADPFKYPELRDALFLSLKVAVVVTLISVIRGTLIAMAMVKYRFKAKGIVGTVLILPLSLPEVVMGFSLLTWFVALNWSRGFATVIIAQVMFSISYVATTVRARIRGFDRRLEEAALDLGAKPWRVFRLVTFPLFRPGILTAALLTFARSLDDFIITYLNSGLQQTFPIEIWTLEKSRIPPQINVFATAILVVIIVMALLGVSIGFRRTKRQGQLNP
jgi:spermidine/putrescine transport system permease protein